MIAIVDYGMGNLRSVQKGLEKVGTSAEIVRGPEAVRAAVLKKNIGLVSRRIADILEVIL